MATATARPAPVRASTPAPTLAERRQAVLDQLAQLDNEEEAERNRQTQALDAELKGFPTKLSTILGYEVSAAEALRMLGRVLSGKPLMSSPTNAMPNEKREELKRELTERQALIDSGKPVAESISQIASRYGVSDATINSWKSKWNLTRINRPVPVVSNRPAHVAA